jgi:hypothetical protein
MLAKMEPSIHPRRLLASALLLFIVTACTPVAEPPLSTATATSAATTAHTPAAIVAFPTAAPETATPAAPLTATLTSRLQTTLPIVQLVSPISNTQVSISQTTYIVAYAADSDGIARIEVYDDNALVRAENAPTSAPPVFSAIIPWTPVDLGTHTLRVIAYDTSNRASTPAEMPVSVTPDTRRPTALILYPIGTPQVELGSLLQIQVAAIDEVGVTQLDLLVDNQLASYITSPTAGGQSPFPAVFTWSALTPGSHTLVVRAHDNQDMTNDSAPLKIQVADTHAPALSLAFDRTNALVNDPITVTIAALDVSGIQRVELWADKDIANTMTSSSPARQTWMTVQTTWQSANPGDYKLFARAYNANGNYADSPAQTISLLRPGQATPTPAPTATPTRTRAPRATQTPRLQPPAPPTAELISPTDAFVAQAPLRVTFGGKGNAELDHIELWGAVPGQPMPQLICTVDARATTQKNAQCDWSPPAGVVSIFAQAVDSYHQSGRSPTITGFIGVPNIPTATPTPISFTARWTAPSYTATLRQTGSALRGEFKMTVSGKDIDGRITSGIARSDRISFHVDLAAPSTPTTAPVASPPITGTETLTTTTATVAPSAVAPLTPAMDFDCNVDAAVSLLSCNWKDARGNSGVVLFHREGGP